MTYEWPLEWEKAEHIHIYVQNMKELNVTLRMVSK